MKNNFKNNLKYLRNKSGIEQLELANMLGLKSASAVSEWEKGVRVPNAGVLSDIANIFNVTIDNLMKINGDLRERSIEFSRSAPGHDLSFIKKATQYLLGHDLLSSKDINYNEIVKLIDKKLLQDFMQTVIKKISVDEDKSISSIEFANGITHRFIYDS